MLGVADFMTSWSESAGEEKQGSHGVLMLVLGGERRQGIKILERANGKIMSDNEKQEILVPENQPRELRAWILRRGTMGEKAVMSCPFLSTPREHYQFWKGDTLEIEGEV